MESKDGVERTERSVFLALGAGEFALRAEESVGVRVGARFAGIRRVGANESVSELPHEGHSAE